MTRRQAVKEALECQDTTLAESVRQFQFRDIRPKAASEIDDLGDASRLLGIRTNGLQRLFIGGLGRLWSRHYENYSVLAALINVGGGIPSQYKHLLDSRRAEVAQQ